MNKQRQTSNGMKIYFASDHAGYELKAALMKDVEIRGHEAHDCGALQYDKDDDYPAFVAKAARLLSQDVANGLDSRAVVICASGQGEAMVANRFKGVRCALYYGSPGKKQTDMSGEELDILSSTRAHNDANCLSLGARFLTGEESASAVAAWLSAPFSGLERHARRIKQIDEVA